MACFVYSTLSASVAYNFYRDDVPDASYNVLRDRVVIVGGANIIDKLLRTPKGVVTKVTDDQMVMLKNHPLFKLHIEKGFILYEENPIIKTSVEKAVKNLSKKDKSAPLVEDDLKKITKTEKVEYTSNSDISEFEIKKI